MKNYSQFLEDQYNRLQEARAEKQKAILNNDDALALELYKEIAEIKRITI